MSNNSQYTSNAVTKRFYPALSTIVNIDELPESLDFVKTALTSIFSKLHYKDLVFNVSSSGDSAFYYLRIVSKELISFEIPGTNGVSFEVSPDSSGEFSSFPITLEYNWPILGLIDDIDKIENPISLGTIFELFQEIFNLSKEGLIGLTANVLIEFDSLQHSSVIEQIASDIEERYSPFTFSSLGSNPVDSLIEQIEKESSLGGLESTVIHVIYETYLESFDINEDFDIDLTWGRFNDLFTNLTKGDVKDYLLELLIPYIHASVELAGAVSFPRDWLIPLYPEDHSSYPLQPKPEPEKARFIFNTTAIHIDSKKGLSINSNIELSSVTPISIGKTGLIAKIEQLKFDLSDNKNLPEIDADGRPNSFKGVYIKSCELMFPNNWGRNDGNQTKITGNDIIFGNEGGISGKFSVSNINKEYHVNFEIGTSDITVDSTNQKIIVTNPEDINEQEEFNFLPSPNTFNYYVKDSKHNYFEIKPNGTISTYDNIHGETYVDFEINSVSLSANNTEIEVTGVIPEGETEAPVSNFEYELGTKNYYIRDFYDNCFKIDLEGVISSVTAPKGILSFNVGTLSVTLDSFDLELHQNSIVSSNVVGTLIIPREQEDLIIRITVDFNDGFIISALFPKEQAIVENEFTTIKLDGIELGKTSGIKHFAFSGNANITSENEFIQKFIPNHIVVNELLYRSDSTLKYEVGVGWKNGSTVTGNSDTGLEIIIPIHKNSDKDRNIKIDSIKILANKDNENLNINTTLLGVVLSIGSLKATVSGLGFGAVIDFPDNGGNFGDANVDLELIPPNSIGLKIDSPSISGSGALKIDAANKRYFGYIQLKFGKVTFTAMGILRTELPGGKKGYSLILIITAENFKPIALGYGFNLIGVGGLIGLNRSVNIDVLRAGLKTGNNEKILFPVNVIENADSIISALDTSFPEKEGRFIFGPLAKINWGTGEESIITIDLGLIIEVPKPVTVALIGVLKAIFPPNKDNSEENAKLIIKVNFLGVFDAEKKMISFDASIYDSKIASFTISGDMAFRLSYGENPGFLLSVGGFHPAYTPPPMDLPNLKRLSISLVDEKKSKVFLETYFAVTSNTVQFGARVIASAENGLYNFAAVLWFDALFQFKPFYFIVNMGGMIAIKSGGKTILTAGLDFTLQGPTPWKIDGKVYFEICKVKKSIKINKEFGKKLPEQNVDVKIEKLLTDAIDNVDNWQIINPRYADFVTISGSDEKVIYLHPTGSIAMNQSSVPLNLTFVKFGNSKPEDYSKFNLDNFKINNEVYSETKLKNGFAPSMYRVMTNEQKLSAPSFEEYESGFIVGTDKISGDFFTKREVGHYEKIIDRAHKVKGVYVAEAETIFNAMLDTNVQNFGGFSGSQNNRPYDSPSPVGVSSEKYTVTNRDTGSPYDSQTFDSFTDALDFSNSILNTNPAMKGKIKVVSTTQLN